jgi:hypothetical protein
VVRRRELAAPWVVDRDQPAFNTGLVIEGRRALVPRVGDNVWSLLPIIAQTNREPGSYSLDFSTFDNIGAREIVRELLFVAINVHPRVEVGEPISGKMTTLAGMSVIQAFRDLRRFFDALIDDGFSLEEITQDWLNEWLIKQESSGPSRKVVLITTIRRLHIYQNSLSFFSLAFMPWGRQSASKVAGSKWNMENTTVRIPEHVMAPVMRWAEFYVDHAVDALLAHRRLFDADLIAADDRPHVNLAVEDRLNKYFAQLRAERRGLPEKPGNIPNYKGVLKAAGTTTPMINFGPEVKQLVDRALVELGGDLFQGQMLPDTTVPWIVDAGRGDTWWELSRALTACYLVAAAYSGARDSEVTDWRRGCLKRILASDGSVHRIKVEGRVIKHAGPAGRSKAWVVIEPVAKAIEAAERIQQYISEAPEIRRNARASAAAGDYLFASAILQGRSRPGDVEGLGVAHNFNEKIRAFVEKCRVHAAAAADRVAAEEHSKVLDLYMVPAMDGAPDGEQWIWRTMQLRRTLAWYIANQPFGVVAGMVQYGHEAALMFEGYAGSSQSGFRLEIEQQRESGRMADIVADYEAWDEGATPSGPMGPRLTDAFKAIREELGDLPGVVTDARRRDRMLKNLVTNVHPGFMNDCFFYRDHAVCIQRQPKKHGGPEADGPFWAKCEAATCPNSSITQRHLPALRACQADIEEMLKVPGQSPLQRTALRSAATQTAGLITKVAG